MSTTNETATMTKAETPERGPWGQFSDSLYFLEDYRDERAYKRPNGNESDMVALLDVLGSVLSHQLTLAPMTENEAQLWKALDLAYYLARGANTQLRAAETDAERVALLGAHDWPAKPWESAPALAVEVTT